MPGANLKEKIALHYDHMTRSARKIADYLLENSQQAQQFSISTLAKECGVAEATVFRFCQTLGFSGYNGLKIALAQTNAVMDPSFAEGPRGRVQAGDDLQTLCARVFAADADALIKTRARLSGPVVAQAVDLLRRAGRVYCLGIGGSLLTAMDAWSRFLTVSDKFYNIQDSHLQAVAAKLLGPQDVILYFSYSAATRELSELLDIARARGTKFILITCQHEQEAACRADVVLAVDGPPDTFQSGSIPVKMAMLFLVDVLANEFIRRDLSVL